MKSILLIGVFFAFASYANESYTLKSKIKKVVVYQQGAQVKRQANFNVQKGTTTLKISGISPSIDPNTIQIQATGNIVILDSKHNINYPEPVNQNVNPKIPVKIIKEIRLLEDSLFDISYQQMAIQNNINVLNSEKQIIQNNGTIKGIGKVNDSIPLLKDALTFYHKKMNAINAELLILERDKLILTRRQTRMNQRLTNLNNYNINNQLVPNQNTNPIHEILITVSAKENINGKVSITYLVANAGWIPLYDLRSSSDKSTIDLTYKAQVYQNTGIDWENTRLNLSTNNPYANKTKPTLNPWFLDYYNAQSYKRKESAAKDKALGYYNESLVKPEATTTESINDDFDESEELIFDAADASQFTTTLEQLITVEYVIDLPYTIKSDNQKNMVLVKNSRLKTNYSYYTVPKLDPSVYLIAQITNLGELNLVPGKATIFHEGSYLGTTYINAATLRDTMDLSLGKTTHFTVKRQLLKNEVKEKIVGEKIVKTHAYQIEIKNHSKRTLNIIVEDQVPVSRNSEIEIELVSQSKGEYNEVNGFLTWKNRLKPQGTKKYELIFSVEHEKTKALNLASN